MNRNIKFRAYGDDTDRWYVGAFVRLERVSGYAWSDDPVAAFEQHERENYDNYIFFTEMNDWGMPTRKLRATVNPMTVGQYTGLKDKGGVEIYEGDILAFRDGVGAVEYLNTEFLAMDVTGHGNCNLLDDRCEVIGNIYDNPELLR